MDRHNQRRNRDDVFPYLNALRRRWKIITAAVVLLGLGGVVYSALTPRVYEATVQIFVSAVASDNTQQLAQGNSFAQARVQSYVDAATSPRVTEQVVSDLGLKITPEQLAAKISADAPLNKVLINIHVQDGNANQSAQLANAVADQFDKVIESLEMTAGDSASPVKLSILRPAEAPTSPIAPRTTINILAGLFAGLVVGSALGLVRDALDNTFKSTADVTSTTGLPVLGIVPLDKRASTSTIALNDSTHSGRAEAFRMWRTNLQFIDIDNPPRIIAVSSSAPADGKTHAAINLAAALAEAGHRVCLIETDLRRPTVAKLLGLVPDAGLTSVLVGASTVEDVLQNSGKNFAVLTSGAIPPNPGELLSSEHFRSLLGHIASQVDYTILDTPPVLAVAESAELCAVADATFLIIKANRTTKAQALLVLDKLSNVGVNPVGAVLSMVPAKFEGRARADYYYYSKTHDASAPN